jgi:protein-disulfide isomerase
MSKLRTAVHDNDHGTGNKNAHIVLVEYGDYQCPHCGHAYPLLKRLMQEMGDQLYFVFRNFPLQEIHPAAIMAAQAAEAAAKQNKFWEMHDLIFEHQDNLHGNTFLQLAEKLKLDLTRFAQDWKSEQILERVETDFESGVRSGVNGTPTFFVNGEMLLSYDETYESLVEGIRIFAD